MGRSGFVVLIPMSGTGILVVILDKFILSVPRVLDRDNLFTIFAIVIHFLV
jgi:hypothetical protein